MKTKRILIIFICVMLAAFLLGAADVARMANASAVEESGKDRLIGVLVTPEHLDLFDAESFFEDNAQKIVSGGEISADESKSYEGRLYAALVENSWTNEETGEEITVKKYVFDTVEGISCFCALYEDGAESYRGSSGDEAISDAHMAISSTDEGESISLEGTIYSSTSGGASAFFYNPVYQTAEGKVYAMTGQGVSYGGDLVAGTTGSYELKEEDSATFGNETEASATCVKMTVCFIDPPTGVEVVQLDGESNVLLREKYAPDALPDSLTVAPGTEYIIVETFAEGEGDPTRELFQPGDESLFAFYSRDDGICVKQSCAIDWVT